MYRTVFTPQTCTGGVKFNPKIFVLNAVLTRHLVSITRERGIKFSVQIRDLYCHVKEPTRLPSSLSFWTMHAFNTKVRGLNSTPPVQVGRINAVLYIVRQVVRSEELELVSVTLTCFLDRLQTLTRRSKVKLETNCKITLHFLITKDSREDKIREF